MCTVTFRARWQLDKHLDTAKEGLDMKRQVLRGWVLCIYLAPGPTGMASTPIPVQQEHVLTRTTKV